MFTAAATALTSAYDAETTAPMTGADHLSEAPVAASPREEVSSDNALISSFQQAFGEMGGDRQGLPWGGKKAKKRMGQLGKSMMQYEDLPPELQRLKIVKPRIYIDAWEALSPAEQAATIQYIVTRDKLLKSLKGKDKVDYASITVKKSKIEDTSQEAIDSAKERASENVAAMSEGDGARVDGVISASQSSSFTPDKIIEQEREAAQEFKVASTFPPDEYTAEMMDNDAFEASLAQAAAEIKRLHDKYGPEVGLDFVIRSGESQIPSSKFKIGELASLRGETAQEQALAYLAAQGIDVEALNIIVTPVIGATEWPDRDDPDFYKLKKERMPAYREEQFLSVSTSLNGDPPPIVIKGDEILDQEQVSILNTVKVDRDGPNQPPLDGPLPKDDGIVKGDKNGDGCVKWKTQKKQGWSLSGDHKAADKSKKKAYKSADGKKIDADKHDNKADKKQAKLQKKKAKAEKKKKTVHKVTYAF